LSVDIVYFSNRSGNTKRFVEKLRYNDIYNVLDLEERESPYVLFVPTYGGGNEGHSIPRPVREFLNNKTNRSNCIAVVGFGNMNFGTHYCKAATMIAGKLGVPILGMVELFGTPEDVIKIQERLEKLNEQLQLS
jgi:protein involved in ribonucleotide reduction